MSYQVLDQLLSSLIRCVRGEGRDNFLIKGVLISHEFRPWEAEIPRKFAPSEGGGIFCDTGPLLQDQVENMTDMKSTTTEINVKNNNLCVKTSWI
jgi:hypothetical protein